MADHNPATDPAADAPDGADGGGSDADSAADSEVPWTDFDDAEESGLDIPPPSRAKPTEVIAGTTAFIEPAVYCTQCPQFDESAGECTNDETEIIETLHDGRFHVTNCPAVTSEGPDFERVQRD
ncbi:hypothetical protein EGH24_08760 [Halonotius terrestris]|uniref:DUF8135 domain-containing protein n=1 Tax=Halonotius terrestris TaxID=2487750 RepID=A0A8J8P9X0_9EURY|nr:hypothetical protein [Halonotius terrestris]TQQ81211.1 hypothetical protein EGH24_08760 [Halonotius terrestris]